MKDFKERVYEVVSSIPAGEFLTYKEVAERAGNAKASRAVAAILSASKGAPCHRVIRSDMYPGGFSKGGVRKKVAMLLKEGCIGVIATDTIYGLLTSALNKEAVKRVYGLKERSYNKPMIVLISSFHEVSLWGVKLSKKEKNMLRSERVSVVIQGVAFRLPQKKELLEILSISGPLVAPSANPEGLPPAKTIKEAQRYFRDKVFYLDEGRVEGHPSVLVDTSGKVLRGE